MGGRSSVAQVVSIASRVPSRGSVRTLALIWANRT
jgi:hypothetical protein